MKKLTLKVEGMHCINCTNRVEKALKENKSVNFVKADFKENKVEIESDLTKEEIATIIDDCGFDVIC